jgi:hypothetical protein
MNATIGSKLGIDAKKKIPGKPRKVSGMVPAHQKGCRREGEVGEAFCNALNGQNHIATIL